MSIGISSYEESKDKIQKDVSKVNESIMGDPTDYIKNIMLQLNSLNEKMEILNEFYLQLKNDCESSIFLIQEDITNLINRVDKLEAK